MSKRELIQTIKLKREKIEVLAVSGVRATRGVVSSAVKVNSEAIGFFGGIFKDTLGQISLLKNYSGPSEADGRKRFQNRVEEFGLDDKALEVQQKQYRNVSLYFAALLFLGFFYGVYSFFTSEYSSLIKSVVSFGWLIPLFLIFIKNAYMYASIRDRNLYSIRFFLRNFISTLLSAKNAAIVVFAFAFTGEAFAQNYGIDANGSM